MTISARSIQKAFRETIDYARWKHPYEVTLTLKQCIYIDHDRGRSRIALTKIDAEQNLRHFLNLLNKRIYGPSAQRHNKRVNVIGEFHREVQHPLAIGYRPWWKPKRSVAHGRIPSFIM